MVPLNLHFRYLPEKLYRNSSKLEDAGLKHNHQSSAKILPVLYLVPEHPFCKQSIFVTEKCKLPLSKTFNPNCCSFNFATGITLLTV